MNTIRGFTLIEVLIAMVLLGVGLLGLASLQAYSLRNTQSAYNRSLATELAYDLADRMRANLKEARIYPTNTYITIAPASAAAQTGCYSSLGCTSAQMAQNDLYEWNSLITTLPSSQSIVCFDSTPNDGTSLAPMCDAVGTTYVIKIWWDDNHDGATDLSFVTSFHL